MARAAVRTEAPPKARRKRTADKAAKSSGRVWTEAYGISLLALAAILFLCLVSYHPADVDGTGLASMTGKTRNLIGPVGAHLADLVLWLLGGSTFLLAACLAGFGFAFLLARRVRLTGRTITGGGLLLVAVAALLHLSLTGQTLIHHAPGGLVGELTGEVLRSLFSTVGSYVLTGSLLAVSVVLVADVSLGELIRRALRAVGALMGSARRRTAEGWADLREARRARKELKARMKAAVEEARQTAEQEPDWSFGDQVSLPRPDAESVLWSFEDEEELPTNAPAPARVVRLRKSRRFA